jgi:hypothetical protein
VAGWGASTWSSGYWGGVEDVPVAISGTGAFGNAGNITYSVTQAITGAAAAGDVGTVAPGRVVAISGVFASGNVGSMVPSRFVGITGTTANGTLGTFGYYYWTAIDDTQNPNWIEIPNF